MLGNTPKYANIDANLAIFELLACELSINVGE
jgi:hypothetical protein